MKCQKNTRRTLDDRQCRACQARPGLKFRGLVFITLAGAVTVHRGRRRDGQGKARSTSRFAMCTCEFREEGRFRQNTGCEAWHAHAGWPTLDSSVDPQGRKRQQRSMQSVISPKWLGWVCMRIRQRRSWRRTGAEPTESKGLARGTMQTLSASRHASRSQTARRNADTDNLGWHQERQEQMQWKRSRYSATQSS